MTCNNPALLGWPDRAVTTKTNIVDDGRQDCKEPSFLATHSALLDVSFELLESTFGYFVLFLTLRGDPFKCKRSIPLQTTWQYTNK